MPCAARFSALKQPGDFRKTPEPTSRRDGADCNSYNRRCAAASACSRRQANHQPKQLGDWCLTYKTGNRSRAWGLAHLSAELGYPCEKTRPPKMCLPPWFLAKFTSTP